MESDVITAIASLADDYGLGVVASLFFGYCLLKWIPAAAARIAVWVSEFVRAQTKIAETMALMEKIHERQHFVANHLIEIREELREIRREKH